MPRLNIPNEPRQEGYARSVLKKRKAPSPPLGSDRASRSKTAAARSGDRHTHPEATQACEQEPKLTC